MLHIRSFPSAVVLLGACLGSCVTPHAHQDPLPPAPEARPDEPTAQFGLALSTDAAWLTTGARLRRAGWMTFEFFGSSDDDYLISGTVLRMGETGGEVPVSLGVGISAYGFHVDLDDDATGGALALRGVAAYELRSAFPSRFAAELSLAPDVSSFGDGDGLLDVSIRYEFDVSDFASAFLGYRRLEVDVEGASSQTLEEGVHLGVRLAY